jgi:hypothetical protein
MKKIYTAFFLLPFSLLAQSPVTHSAGYGETVPSPACLACAGSEWSNEMNVTATDNAFATTGLNQNAFCFQSTCFYSRYLYAHNFNFSIPSNATIDTIIVDIIHRAGTINTVKDSIVQLQKMMNITGANLASSAFWPTAAATASYGNTDPLWSTTWTPADINDPSSGVVLKVVNYSSAQEQAGIDHIQMTIFYTTSTGIHSVTASPSAVTWINSVSKTSAHIFLENNSTCVSTLYDVTGNILSKENQDNLSQGENDIEMPMSGLAPGIYFWRIQIGDKFYTKKISVL